MAIRPIVHYPDPILKKVAPPCHNLDEIRGICQDLVDTMRSHERCVGLAAPQIGVPARVIAIDVSGHRAGALANHGPLVLINPRVVETAGYGVGREGCLSLPKITANVGRPERIVFEGSCLNGQTIRSITWGFEARALQHEIDHLDGILILDRVASPSEIFQRQRV